MIAAETPDDELAAELGLVPDDRPVKPCRLIWGDCRQVLPHYPPAVFDAVATDPPYELDFMGRAWDRSGVAFDVATWTAALRVLKPGGYMVAFGGTRTYHRMACAIEDAGFEMRDCLMWLYGTGFPKGDGNLKPAYEPIVLARRPANRVLPLGIDACRVPTTDKLGGGAELITRADQKGNDGWVRPWMSDTIAQEQHASRVRDNVIKAESLGRYPANVLHDGSEDVVNLFAEFGTSTSAAPCGRRTGKDTGILGAFAGQDNVFMGHTDSGTAARFFYCAKASQAERGEANNHPTVKPLELMQWLVRLICPRGGTVLDPFAGSGSTIIAARNEGRICHGIELDHHESAGCANRTGLVIEHIEPEIV